MNNDSPQKALLVVFLVALICSVLVSVATIVLEPIQLRNQLIDRSRNIIGLTGLVAAGEALTDDEILEALERLDIRTLDIDTGIFEPEIDPVEFDERAAINDPDLSISIPAEEDKAGIGRRSRYAIVYIVWDGDDLQRVIVPVYGQGMWSTLYGYLALEADLNTIAAVTFYEQAETAGLGDQILRADWQRQWRGRTLYDARGNFRFRVAPGSVEDGSASARHEVDGLTGATVTGNSVTQLVAYWLGPNGYAKFLGQMQARPPVRSAAKRGDDK